MLMTALKISKNDLRSVHCSCIFLWVFLQTELGVLVNNQKIQAVTAVLKKKTTTQQDKLRNDLSYSTSTRVSFIFKPLTHFGGVCVCVGTTDSKKH